jgi:hypothetical protein
MSTMSTSESNTYLAELIAEMLAMHCLPVDLRHALTEHLNKQFSMVNLLKPEYCRRLYPILAELAELQGYSEITTSVTKSDVESPEPNGACSSDSLYEEGGNADAV